MRVEFDDVDTDDDTRVEYQGEPFTGEVVERAPDGQVIALTSYFNGVEDGPTTEWYPTGELKATGSVAHGRAVGLHEEWYRDGTLAAQDEFDERGRHLARRRWDEAGNPTEDKAYRD